MLHSNDLQAAATKVVLKKYGKNRRLYDTSSSRYVNLEEVATLIRNGTEVQVIDSETGEDLTRMCLMQIIMDDAREKPTGLPLELLRHLIVASDHVGREFIMWYLQSAFDTYRKVQSSLQTGLNEVHIAARSPINLVKDFIQSTVSETQTAKQAEKTELEELRGRVAELERALTKNARPKRSKS
jgi:polyhydroxyalkanoate synthesis repressor PhaR